MNLGVLDMSTKLRRRPERPSACPEQGQGPPSPTTALGLAKWEPLALDGGLGASGARRRGVAQVSLP